MASSKPDNRVHHRSVLRDRLVGRDEIGQRRLHAVESGCGLHQAAELHGAGEIGRAHHQIRKDHRSLRIALGEERQLLLPVHDGDPVDDDQPEAAEVTLALGGFAVQRRDLLGILAGAHQIEAKIGLVALLLEVERNKPPADQMGERGADYRVEQGRPDQIARNRQRHAEQMQRRRFADSVHRMTTNEHSVTQELKSPSPIDSVLCTNICRSSAMRWSGLSAASPRSCMR